MKILSLLLLAAWSSLFVSANACGAEKIKALIVDGQNNHQVWPKSTIMMKQYLEESGLFEVTVARTRWIWSWAREEDWLPLAKAGASQKLMEPKRDETFAPDFDSYDLVVSNFGWQAAPWPAETQRNFENFVSQGGGFVVVHAANNSWPEWPEYNRMIGVGGWGGRDQSSGPAIYLNDKGELVKDESAGIAGRHGPQNEFVVTIRDQKHPITKGLPSFWVHSRDECYSHLRGPAENLTVLATASDTPELQKTGRHEPILMTIGYHKGRIFHTTLGHDAEAFEGVGFITTFLRGCEWAATGAVTQELPKDFPTAAQSNRRPFQYNGTKDAAKDEPLTGEGNP